MMTSCGSGDCDQLDISVDSESLKAALQLLASKGLIPASSVLDYNALIPSHRLQRSENLAWWQVLCAVALMLVNVTLLMLLQLNLHMHLVFAIIGCLLQLTILGHIVTYLSEWHQSWLMLLYALMAITMATMEAVSRPNHTYVGMRIHMLSTITGSSSLVFLFSMLVVLQLPVDHVLQPQYLIPLFGLLVGHVITGISSGVTATLEELAQGRERVEVLLSMGATRLEATRTTVQLAATSALLPIMEHMSVVGLVALPSFMAGQLIHGQQPMQAAKYQIVVMFLIAAASGLGSIAAIYMAVFTIVDRHHRLRLDLLQHRKQPHTGYIMMLVAIAKQAYTQTQKWVRRVNLAFSHHRPYRYRRPPPRQPFADPEHTGHTPLHPTRHSFRGASSPTMIPGTLEYDTIYEQVQSPSSSILQTTSVLQTSSLQTSVAHSPTGAVIIPALPPGINGAGGGSGGADTGAGVGATGGGYTAALASAASAMANTAAAGSERLRVWLMASLGRGQYSRVEDHSSTRDEGFSTLQTVINPPGDDSGGSVDGSYSDTYPIIDLTEHQCGTTAPQQSSGHVMLPPLASP